MTFNPINFAEDTSFERHILEILGNYRTQVDPPRNIYNNNGITGEIRTAEEGVRLREELRNSRHSLSFGAAYKVLDILIEHVVRANDPSIERLSFIDKNKTLETRPKILPPPLNSHLELWSRLAILYSVFQEARHAVVHRRCQLTNTGDLEIHDNQNKHTHTITSCKISFFVAAVHTVAGLLINAHSDNRRTKFATWYLNKLQSRDIVCRHWLQLILMLIGGF